MNCVDRRAAEARCIGSMMFLANQFGEQDLGERMKWLRLASEAGHQRASIEIGELYITGQDTSSQDTRVQWASFMKGIESWELSVEQNHLDQWRPGKQNTGDPTLEMVTLFNLARFYSNPGSTPLKLDMSKALKYAAKSSQLGYKPAQMLVELLLPVGSTVEASGLEESQQLNGKIGVVAPTQPTLAAGRVHIFVDGCAEPLSICAGDLTMVTLPVGHVNNDDRLQMMPMMMPSLCEKTENFEIQVWSHAVYTSAASA